VAKELMPYQIIDGMIAARETLSDEAILAELSALPPLADEDDRCWDQAQYWHEVAHPYLALAGLCARRRLLAAIPLLLERACFGDPGEIRRGLRHCLEATVAPDWSILADFCLRAAQSPRRGTRLWAIDQLVVLEDPRAAPLFERAQREEPEEISWRAAIGLERLGKAS
jgi:hypothetical protein